MNPIPSIHFKSLHELEQTYWWHISRLNWTEYILRNFFSDSKMAVALDYGCGTGGFIRLLAERCGFKDYLGVDISQEAIDYALRLGDKYRVIQPNQMDVIANADLIFLMDVLEHIKDDKSFLNAVFDNLKPNARVLFSVPAMPSLFSYWDLELGHYRRYTRRDVINFSRPGSVNLICQFNALSYIVPSVVFLRKLKNHRPEETACEFPGVPEKINNILILLNKLEIGASRIFKIPFGSSIFGMFEKK